MDLLLKEQEIKFKIENSEYQINFADICSNKKLIK